MARKQTKARRGKKGNRRTRRNGRKMMKGGIGYGIYTFNTGIGDYMKKSASNLISRVAKQAVNLESSKFNEKFSAVRVVGPYEVYRISNYGKDMTIKFDFSPVYSPNKTVKQGQLFGNKQKIVDSLKEISSKSSSNSLLINNAIDNVNKSDNGLKMMENLKGLIFEVTKDTERLEVITLLTTKDVTKNMLFAVDSKFTDKPVNDSTGDDTTPTSTPSEESIQQPTESNESKIGL